MIDKHYIYTQMSFLNCTVGDWCYHLKPNTYMTVILQLITYLASQ
jgi:hypothetical protein